MQRENLVKLVQDLGLESEAVEAASTGSKWSKDPCIGLMIEDVYWCDDCDAYHKFYWGFGYEIEDDKLLCIYWEFDGDDWTSSAMEVETVWGAQMATAVDWEEIMERRLDYEEWMKKEGKEEEFI